MLNFIVVFSISYFLQENYSKHFLMGSFYFILLVELMLTGSIYLLSAYNTNVRYIFLKIVICEIGLLFERNEEIYKTRK